MATKRNVTKKEYNEWVKYLHREGYSGPFAGLTTKHECVKLLNKVLKRGTIPGTRSRDPRTIASNLTRYEERGRPRLGRGEPETIYQDIDTIVLMPGLERRHKTFILRNWMDLGEREIAEKLGISLRDVEHDREETEKELVSKTKEVSKVEQNKSMLNLPFWVNQAQLEHLDGKEQRDELGGISLSGIGIRQQLESFIRDHFRDINPQYRPFWHPLDEVVQTQLQGHLPDKTFWSTVRDFSEKDGECHPLLDAAYESFISGGEELELLQPRRGPTPKTYTTSWWGDTLIVGVFLGIKEELYSPHELTDGDFLLDYNGHSIYCGPDPVGAGQRHRQLAEDFGQTDKFNVLVSLMEKLRDLRQQIIARINECLRRKEYYLYYCPDCPADQYRKMLAGK